MVVIREHRVIGNECNGEGGEDTFRLFVESLALLSAEFARLDRKFAEDMFSRNWGFRSSRPVRPVQSPYIAAALSLSVGAFGDLRGHVETEEEARRRVSNTFRNAWEAVQEQRKRGVGPR